MLSQCVCAFKKNRFLLLMVKQFKTTHIFFNLIGKSLISLTTTATAQKLRELKRNLILNQCLERRIFLRNFNNLFSICFEYRQEFFQRKCGSYILF